MQLKPDFLLAFVVCLQDPIGLISCSESNLQAIKNLPKNSLGKTDWLDGRLTQFFSPSSDQLHIVPVLPCVCLCTFTTTNSWPLLHVTVIAFRLRLGPGCILSGCY